jgi:hypothetical protein
MGFVEEDTYRVNSSARVGKWKVSKDNKVYESISAASRETGIHKSKITRYLKNNQEGFKYEYSYEIYKRPYK